MTFRDFLALHARVEGFDDLGDPDVTILHALELAHRHPGARVLADLREAALRELRAEVLPQGVLRQIELLWALFRFYRASAEIQRTLSDIHTGRHANRLTESTDRSNNEATSGQHTESDVATSGTETNMSLEAAIEKLTAAVERNTEALLGGKDAPATTERRTRRSDSKDEKDEGRSSRRSDSKDDKKITLDDLKATAAKFLDLPADKDGDAEYEKRLTDVFDPLFKKADVKEVADLPEKYWQDLHDAIGDYEKKNSDTGSRRRR